MKDFWIKILNEYKKELTEQELLVLILIINNFFK